jgi:hypothetical protein
MKERNGKNRNPKKRSRLQFDWTVQLGDSNEKLHIASKTRNQDKPESTVKGN